MSQFFSKVKKKIGDFFYKNRYGTIIILAGIVIVIWDLFFKYMLDNKTLKAIPNIFSVMSSHNTGGAWSIFSDLTWLLIVVSVILLIGIIIFNFFLKISKKSYVYAIGLGLLLGGAFGNLFDRVKYGYVRDFIKLEFIDFPIFNIADIAITAGVIILCVHFLILLPKKLKKEELKSEENTNKSNNKASEQNTVSSDENSKEIVEDLNEFNQENSILKDNLND